MYYIYSPVTRVSRPDHALILKRTIHFSVIIFLKVSYENILKINETRTIDNYFFNRNHIVIQQLYISHL